MEMQVFGSSAHTISVLIHQMPGLALFALKHYPPPGHVARYLPGGSRAEGSPPKFSFFWSFVAPVLFYLGWQLAYFLIVQVSPLSVVGRSGWRRGEGTG